MIRISELSLPLDHRPDALRSAIIRRLRIEDTDLIDFTVFKRSYDARKKNTDITFVYIVDLVLRDEAAVLARFADDTHVRPAPDTGASRHHRIWPLWSVCGTDSGADGVQADCAGAGQGCPPAHQGYLGVMAQA